MSRILDPKFRYTPSFATDIRKRFEKVKRARRAEQQRNAEEAAAKVQPLPARKAGRG